MPTAVQPAVAPGVRPAPRAATVPLFAAALFLSALLLFAVQPMFTKMVLPVLGGSPAVWSIALVFFQALLLAGYCYAHLLARYASTGAALALHLALMLGAGLSLPIAIPAGWTSAPADGEAFWLLGLFAVSVGLPFFALAANGPLLQAWFSRSGHPRAADPYFLYAASNVGSFAALVAYPLAVEPLLPDAGADRRLVHGLCGARGPHRRLRSSRRRALAAARDGARRRRDGRHRAGAVAGARRLGRPRLRSVRPSRRRHGPHLDRHRRGAAAVGRAAGAVPRHLRPRLPRQGARPRRRCSRASRSGARRWR